MKWSLRPERLIALIVVGYLLLVAGAVAAQDTDTPPDMSDPLGRYLLWLPTGWDLVDTNSKLKGLVLGNREDSFVAVYHDGKLSPTQAIPTMAALCACPIPSDAKAEPISGAAYPAQLIQIGHDGRGTVVVGTVLFPGGMFGLLSDYKNERTRASLIDVLKHARPGPSRPKN